MNWLFNLIHKCGCACLVSCLCLTTESFPYCFFMELFFYHVTVFLRGYDHNRSKLRSSEVCEKWLQAPWKKASKWTLYLSSNLRIWKMKPMQKCLKQHSVYWPAGGEVRLYWGLWENDSTSHLIYCLSKLVPNDLMVFISSFKSSSVQHDVHFVNYGPI